MRSEWGKGQFGLRNEKVVDSDGNGSADLTQRYALDGWDVFADLDASSSLTTRYVRGDVVDQLFARLESDGDAFWDYTDHLGSIRDITDNTGVIVDALTYDAFGNIISETDPQYRGRYAYTGRELDAETDLQYNRARYYDATTGRWLSQDPLGFEAGDSNLYRYVNNGPTKNNDPSGRDLYVQGQEALKIVIDYLKHRGGILVKTDVIEANYFIAKYQAKLETKGIFFQIRIDEKNIEKLNNNILSYKWPPLNDIFFGLRRQDLHFVIYSKQKEITGIGDLSSQNIDPYRGLSSPLISIKEKFLKWYEDEKKAGLFWTKLLDLPPNEIRVDECCIPCIPAGWEKDPGIFFAGSKYHPGAVFGIRKAAKWGRHGNQATYDANFKIITGGLGAGTADKAFPGSFMSSAYYEHQRVDVIPFDWAYALDKHYGGTTYRYLYMEVRPPVVRPDAPTKVVTP